MRDVSKQKRVIWLRKKAGVTNAHMLMLGKSHERF